MAKVNQEVYYLRDGRVDEVVEYLSYKHEVQSSNPSTTKKKKKRKRDPI
jgi:hypothetical protein